MCHLISSKSYFFGKPQQLNIADRTYPDVCSSVVKDFIDGDNKRKQVYFLDCSNSTHVSYVHGNKVMRSEERYNTPLVKKLGDKIYHNITSKIERADKGYDVYTVEAPSGYNNNVRVYKRSGVVVDTNDLQLKAMKQFLLKPFKKVAQLFR